MDATPCRTDEGSFKVNAHDFSAWASLWNGTSLTADEARDALGALADALLAGRHRGGQQRSGSARSSRFRDRPERLFGGLHHIVAASPMDVHVQETRHERHPARSMFLGARRHGNLAPAACGNNLFALDNHNRVGDFFKWGQGVVRVNDQRSHSRAPSYSTSRRARYHTSSGEKQKAGKTEGPARPKCSRTKGGITTSAFRPFPVWPW